MFGSLVVDSHCEDLFGDASVVGAGYFSDELEFSCCNDASGGLDIVELFTYCFVFDTLFLDL